MLISKDTKLIVETGQERFYNQLKSWSRVYVNEFDVKPLEYETVKKDTTLYKIATKDREITLLDKGKVMTNQGFVDFDNLLGKSIMFVVPKATAYGTSFVALEEREVISLETEELKDYECLDIARDTLVVNGAYVKVE